jgi:isocitrate dehydrogenase kinase/phosphatase
MGNKTIYLRDLEERELELEAQRRGVRSTDLLRERMNTGKLMEEFCNEVKALHEDIERLEEKIEIQNEWSNKMAGLILAKTSFLEELFMLINTENDREERTQAASEAAAKFMETLRR